MLRTFIYRFNGPPCQTILIKQRGNNAKLNCQNPMPNSFYPMSHDNTFSMSRASYIQSLTTFTPDTKLAGNVHTNVGRFDSRHHRVVLAGKPVSYPKSAEERTRILRINAIGQSSMKAGLPTDADLSFRSQDKTIRNDALRRCRAGGCTAPRKKGAIENNYQSGGYSIFNSSGNRQIFAP